MLRQKLLDADKDLDATNTALHNLRKAKEAQEEFETQEPAWVDYYKPSDEMKTYMHIVMGLLGLGSGFSLAWFL